MFDRSRSQKAPLDSSYPQIEPLNSQYGVASEQASWHDSSNYGGSRSSAPQPSAPPHPDTYAVQTPAQHQQAPQHAVPQTQLPPGQVLVSTPKIEAQPWVRDLWNNVAAKTVGVARVDLRRPTFPWPEDYDTGNILFKRGGGAPDRRGRRQPRKQQPLVGYAGDADGPYFPSNQPGYTYGTTPAQQQQQQQHLRQQPTGARLKVMRCLQLKAPENKKALLDLGLGLAVDLDRQELQGVARLKVADLLSLKLLPQPLLKLGGSWSLPGTGMAVRLKYEVPLVHMNEFWQPPARLMVRLDNDVGTGVHLTPTGIEFDERRLALGKSTEVRAGATLRFPRSLPVDRDDPDAFKLNVHRLSLKTLW